METKRASWASNLGFLMAAIGSAPRRARRSDQDSAAASTSNRPVSSRKSSISFHTNFSHFS